MRSQPKPTRNVAYTGSAGAVEAVPNEARRRPSDRPRHRVFGQRNSRGRRRY